MDRDFERTRLGDSDLDLLRFLAVPDSDRRRSGDADRDLWRECDFKPVLSRVGEADRDFALALDRRLGDSDRDFDLERDFDRYFFEGAGKAVPYRFGEADREKALLFEGSERDLVDFVAESE
jgi:hypothetical protein